MKANPEHQRALLDVAELDQRKTRAEHARKNPPQAARVSELNALRQEQLRELTTLTGARDDIQTELSRLETDVSLVEQRSERDAQRLAASTNSKDAVALEQEIESLARRKSMLEDAELEVMAKLEEAEAGLAAQQALVDLTTVEGTELSAQAKAQIAAATAELEHLVRDRAALTADLPEALVALYERLNTDIAGAGLLRRGTCEGCRMVLSGIDMSKIRQSPADEVVMCPDCGCILVRTEESGL